MLLFAKKCAVYHMPAGFPLVLTTTPRLEVHNRCGTNFPGTWARMDVKLDRNSGILENVELEMSVAGRQMMSNWLDRGVPEKDPSAGVPTPIPT